MSARRTDTKEMREALLSRENENLKGQLKLDEALKLERETSDKRYADKLVQTIMYSLIGAAGLTLLGFALNIIFRKGGA